MSGSRATASRHFRVQPLAEGVFAAIAQNGASAVCNAGLVDLGGQTLLFDTSLTPQAATDLRQAMIHLLGSPPCLVVNSHYHNDHVWGNQVFAAEAPILSSRRTRERMVSAGAEELTWYATYAAQRLEAHRAACQAGDERQRQEALLWIGEYEGIVEALPHLRVCLPDITYDNNLEIHGSRYTAELIGYEGAHTGHDTALLLPQAGIVFAGDLLFVGCHPYLGDGEPTQLLKALRGLAELQAGSYVPGHGPVGTVDDVRRLIGYVEHCLETARELVAAGDPPESGIAAIEIPERYAHWWAPSFYKANLRFLCERLSSADQEVPRTRHGLVVDQVVSALQKEIRRGHTENAALLAYEMLTTGEELEAKLWQRLQVISVEDVGNGQPDAPLLVQALYQMHLDFPRPQGDRCLFAIHAVRTLCGCTKDRSSDELLSWIKQAVEADGLRPAIPDYALDMHTAAGRERGRGKRHFLEEGAVVCPELAGHEQTYRRRLLERLDEEEAGEA